MTTNPIENPKFEPRCPSYKHQSESLERSKDMEYFAFFWEMGLGKSKITIETAAHLFLKGEIDGVLIVAPKGGYLNWPLSEIGKHLPEGIKYRSAYYSSHMPVKLQREIEELCTAKDDTLDFLTVNVEALSTHNGFFFATLFSRNHYTLMVIDESQTIKSPKAKRTDAALKLARTVDYRRLLTGTPMLKGPLDLYTQLEFLRRGLSGFNSFWAFKSNYAISTQIVLGTRRFEKVTGYRDQARLAASLAPYVDKRLKVDCLDLPEKIFETVYVEWTPEQAHAYKTLREAALVEFDRGIMTTTSALTTLTRLHQINCGYATLEDGTHYELPNNRVQSLMDILEDVPGKTIIWARFRHDIGKIKQAIVKEYGERSVVTYYGGNNQIEKIEAIKSFTNNPECRFFVANAASAGRALTLTVATTAIYYSLSYSLEEWLQSQDRNHRIGQTLPVTYITLQIPGTVDDKVVKALKEKREITSSVLDEFRSLT